MNKNYLGHDFKPLFGMEEFILNDMVDYNERHYMCNICKIHCVFYIKQNKCQLYYDLTKGYFQELTCAEMIIKNIIE